MTISLGQGICGNDIIPLSSLQLIGISGHAGVGKDTVARYIQEKYQNTYIESFAKPLKIACAAAFGIPLEWFNEQELKAREVFWGTTPRKIAQFVGTEMFRITAANLYGEFTYSHWIRLLEMRLTGVSAPPAEEGFYEPGDTILIPDVRFQDEADWIRKNNGIIVDIHRIGCNGNVGIVGHASEQGYVIGDYRIVNDYSLEDLYESVDQFLNNYIGSGQLKLTPEVQEINGYSIDI